MLKFEVDPRAPTPPSEQLADQVRFAVAAGRLVPGERLPSVRALAASARVNPNTVARAYRELEREGTVAPRPGSGVYVATDGPALCRALRTRVVAERIGRAVLEARSAGLDDGEIMELVRQVLDNEAPREQLRKRA